MEETSDTKHEFRHGRIIDTTWETDGHEDIAAHLFFGLKSQLKGRPYRPVTSNVRIRIGGSNHYNYPDLTVHPLPALFDRPGRRSTITNPKVIFEVTSPTTVHDDRSEKLYDYISIETLQEYIIVAQDRARVDTFYRQIDGIWAIGPSSEGMEASLNLRSLDITIPLADIYAGVELPKQLPEAPKTT
jgi:Uma2 family endonuclease